MPILNDVPIKGCIVEEKNEIMDKKGCCKFVLNHIINCEKILSRLEEVYLTLSRSKFT
jgi:hypothetical protein